MKLVKILVGVPNGVAFFLGDAIKGVDLGLFFVKHDTSTTLREDGFLCFEFFLDKVQVGRDGAVARRSLAKGTKRAWKNLVETHVVVLVLLFAVTNEPLKFL